MVRIYTHRQSDIVVRNLVGITVNNNTNLCISDPMCMFLFFTLWLSELGKLFVNLPQDIHCWLTLINSNSFDCVSGINQYWAMRVKAIAHSYRNNKCLWRILTDAWQTSTYYDLMTWFKVHLFNYNHVLLYIATDL